MVNILSFDCGVKSLGCILVNISNDYTEIRQLIHVSPKNIQAYNTWLQKIYDCLRSIVVIKYTGVEDLANGVKFNIFKKSHHNIGIALNKYLKEVDKVIGDDHIDYVLVEKQMGCDTNVLVEGGILTYYGYVDNVICVGASTKNTITIGGSEGNYQNFIKKYANSHYANKKHTEYNFKKWLELFDIKTNIPKSKINHVADAFFQIFHNI